MLQLSLVLRREEEGVARAPEPLESDNGVGATPEPRFVGQQASWRLEHLACFSRKSQERGREQCLGLLEFSSLIGCDSEVETGHRIAGASRGIGCGGLPKGSGISRQRGDAKPEAMSPL